MITYVFRYLILQVSIDSGSDTPTKPFRGQVVSFFLLPAHLIVNSQGDVLSPSPGVQFTLLGTYRTVQHLPFIAGPKLTANGKEFSRAKLLGTTLVRLPPNHIQVMPRTADYILQRFVVVNLSDMIATLHIIPLTCADGSIYIARFAADEKMRPSLPATLTKQLFLLNRSIYVY